MVVIALVVGLLLGAAVAALVVRAHYAGRIAMLDEARDSFSSTMKALAADALATSNTSFLELAKTQLEQLQQRTTQDLEQRKQAVEHLVGPIRESLQKVDGRLQELEVARTRAYSELTVQVRQLAETQSQLRSETGNLVSSATGRTCAVGGARSSSAVSSRWQGWSSTATSRHSTMSRLPTEPSGPTSW
jgi:DNA anti-recombination protein RmuC